MLQTLTYKVNVAPDGVPPMVRLSQNENGRKLQFELCGKGEVNIPNGSQVTISGTKPDGVVYSATGSLSGVIATFSEDVQMTAVAGEWDAKLRIIYNGETIATIKIWFAIDSDSVEPGSVPSESELNGLVAEAQQYAETARSEAYGSPLTASTAAAMTNTDKVYVYTGSESGYLYGHWYYYNGTAWTDGGVYQSQGVQTDPTLTQAGVPADAKATGDALATKVDKVTGKGLSTEDFTTAEKNKLAGIEAGANKTVIDNTLTQTGKAADAKKTGDEIADLKDAIKNNGEGTSNLGLYVPFVNGSLYQGQPTPSIVWRIASTAIISFSDDIRLTPANGFKFGVHTFVNGEFSSDSGWITSPYTIPAGTSFKITISRVTEDQTEVANVSYFVNQVLFPTEIGEAVDRCIEDINAINYSINTINEPYTFIDGYYVNYSTGKIESDSAYEYTNIDVRLFAGSVITGQTAVAPNSAVGIAFYNADGAYISGAHSTNTGNYQYAYSLIIPNNAVLMRISLRKLSSALWIKPKYSWGDFNTNLQNVFTDTNKNSVDIDVIKNALTIEKTANLYGKFVQGGVNSDGTLKPEQYYRVTGANHITVNNDTLISADNGYRFGYIPFVNGDAGEWSGWFTTSAVVPKGTEFVLQISTSPEDQTIHANPTTYANAIKVSSPDYGHAYGSDMVKRDITANKINGTLLCRQGFCVYDSKYYSVEENKLGVQNLSFETLDTVTLSMGHANNIQLGNSNLAYVNGIYDHTVYVLNLDTKAIVSTISLPFSSGMESAVIDDINNIAYILHTDDSESTTIPQNFTFIAYDITNSQVMYTKPLPFSILMIQGMDFYEGKILVLAGNNTNTRNRLYVLDLNGTAIGGMYLTMFDNDEPEGVFSDRGTGELFVSGYMRKIYNIRYLN